MYSHFTHRKYSKIQLFVRKLGGVYASGHFCYNNKKEIYMFFITNKYLIDIGYVKALLFI